ncbi:DUF342 domain-containing protein [Candidatus Latescibacterota bacterium]
MKEKIARLEIKVAKNKKRVLADFTPYPGVENDLTYDQINIKLQMLGVQVGIDEDKIRTICNSEKPLRNIVIAECIYPERGENARLKYYIDINERRKAVEQDDGSIDFRDLGEISSACAGQVLYKRIPPTIGAPGKDVYGIEIPGLPGKDLKINLGAGTEIDEGDENLVRASNDGEILIINGIIQISSVYKVIGNVDYSTGNLKYNGAVKVSGDVKSGFKIEADGDIEIRGFVENAEVSSGNDVIIYGGFSGMGEGVVKANRDVIAKYVENQTIQANRDIIISGHSYHSNLLAGRAVIVKGSQSAIVGGECKAETGVSTNRLGSINGTKTVVKVGYNKELSDSLFQCEKEIGMMEEEQHKLEQNIENLTHLKTIKKGILPQEKTEQLEMMEMEYNDMYDKLREIKSKKDALDKEQEKLNNAEVLANTSAFQNVQVYYGQQYLTVKSNLGPSVFKLSNSEVIRLSK